MFDNVDVVRILQSLKSEVDEKQKEIEDISEEANTMISQAPSGSLQVTRFNYNKG